MYLPLLRLSFCDYLVRCFVSECLCLGFPSWNVTVFSGLQRNPVSFLSPPSVVASYIVPWTMADVLRFCFWGQILKALRPCLQPTHLTDLMKLAAMLCGLPYRKPRWPGTEVASSHWLVRHWARNSPAVHMEARPFPAGFLNDRWASTDWWIYSCERYWVRGLAVILELSVHEIIGIGVLNCSVLR